MINHSLAERVYFSVIDLLFHVPNEYVYKCMSGIAVKLLTIVHNELGHTHAYSSVCVTFDQFI